MKFTCIVEINAPRRRVVQLFMDESQLAKWQDGFLRIGQRKGQAGQVGAKRKMFYKQGKRNIEILETIQKSNLPDEIMGLYEHVHMINTMHNVFKDLGERTRWEMHIEYTQFNLFGLKVMAFLLPKVFKKQTQKWLNQFKTLAESQN